MLEVEGRKYVPAVNPIAKPLSEAPDSGLEPQESTFGLHKCQMQIRAVCDGDLGSESILKHWTEANGTKCEDYYSHAYIHEEGRVEVGVRLYDSTMNNKTQSLRDSEKRETNGFIVCFSTSN